jgi:hypothetical protein
MTNDGVRIYGADWPMVQGCLIEEVRTGILVHNANATLGGLVEGEGNEIRNFADYVSAEHSGIWVYANGHHTVWIRGNTIWQEDPLRRDTGYGITIDKTSNNTAALQAELTDNRLEWLKRGVWVHGYSGTSQNPQVTLLGNCFDNFNYDPLTLSSSDEVLGDPAFVGGGNYNLTASSAAINAGTDAGVPLDYFGGHRPWGGGFEIGAEEYPRQIHIFLPLVMR